MLPDPPPARPVRWKRNPGALWLYIALGVGRIILTGIGLVFSRRKRK